MLRLERDGLEKNNHQLSTINFQLLKPYRLLKNLLLKFFFFIEIIDRNDDLIVDRCLS